VIRAFLLGPTHEILTLPIDVTTTIRPIQGYISLICIQPKISLSGVQAGIGDVPQNDGTNNGHS
jgi:hypothetical protein